MPLHHLFRRLRAALLRQIRRWLLRGAGRIVRLISRRTAAGRRVLVIKPDHLGDVLLLTPALHVLRQQQPNAHITLLIGPWSQAAVAHNRDIDTLLTCPFPGFTRTAKPGLLQPYWVLLKMALLLRPGRYDAALIARDDHWWGALLAGLSGIPQRIGYALPETTPFLTTALPHTFADHVASQSIALVEALTGRAADLAPPLSPPIGASDHRWAEEWLSAHDVAPDAQLVAIHPGAGGAAKLWVARRWATLANLLHQRGLIVVLTGGPAEAAQIETIAAAMRQSPLLLVGTASLGQLAALYHRCTLVIGVDSGPLHFAVAAGAPTIALFGPGDQARFGPWGDPARQVVLRSGLWCSPCGVLDACPRGTAPSECMALITTDQVFEAAMRLLERQA